jgi:hypothetical protein
MNKKENFKIIDFCNFKSNMVCADLIKSNILEQIGPFISSDKIKSYYHSELLPVKYRLRTNGIKAYIYFTTYNNRQYSYIIEQNSPNKVEIINCRLRVSPELYIGTLFYGELVITKQQQWHFLLTDILYYNAEEVLDKSFFHNSFQLEKYYKSDPIMEFVKIVTDKSHDINLLKELSITQLLESPYCYIGIEFTLDNLTKRIVYFDNFNNMLESPSSKQNIKEEKQSFYIKYSGRPDIYYLLQSPEDVKTNNIALVKELDMSLLLRDKTKNNNIIKCECIYNQRFNKWHVITV